MNMRTIALKAGVSSATVSRVLNGSSLVTEETAKRVRKVLEESNFIPNPSATTLKYGRSKTYGLIIPDINNPFYSEFLGYFEELLQETEHEFLLATVQSSSTKLVQSVRRMLMRRVDGVVLMASEFDTSAIEPLLEHKVPIVTVDRHTVHIGTSDVAIDFEEGMDMAISHLAKMGHTRIGFIGGIEGLRTSQIRLDAFKHALQNVGLRLFPELLRAGDYRLAGGETAAFSLLKEYPRPTAILTANDLTAFGAIRAFHKAGINVPEEISVIGFDDILLCDVLQPPLTTIRIPRRRMAEACLRALEHIKDNVDRRGSRYKVPSELIVRESTCRPPKRNPKATRQKH